MSQNVEPPSNPESDKYEVDGEWLKTTLETLGQTVAGLSETVTKLLPKVESESNPPLPESNQSQNPPQNPQETQIVVQQPANQDNGAPQKRRSQLVIRNPFNRPPPAA